MANPLERVVFDTSRLMAEHPPQWRHPNKRAGYEIACPPGSTHAGSLVYSRWEALPLPETVNLAGTSSRVTVREDVYDYSRVLPSNEAVEWHVNFADTRLFFGYNSSLFAQDEVQVAEMPILAHLLGRYCCTFL